MGSGEQGVRRNGGVRLDRFREMGILLTGVLIFVIVTLINPKFIGMENLRSIMLYIPLIMVVSMGEMIVIVTRNIDLSVGSILGFSGIAVGMIFVRNTAFPIGVAFLLGTLIGAALGLVNGLLVTRLHLPAIIVTLGSLNLFRGGLFILSGGRQVDPNYIPQGLIALSQTSPVWIPWIVLFALGIAVLFGLFLRFSHAGREMYAIGSNPQAAILRGINVRGVLLLVFVLCGATAGFAGIMYASRFGYVNPGNDRGRFRVHGYRRHDYRRHECRRRVRHGARNGDRMRPAGDREHRAGRSGHLRLLATGHLRVDHRIRAAARPGRPAASHEGNAGGKRGAAHAA